MKSWSWATGLLLLDVLINAWLVFGVGENRGLQMIADDGLIQMTGFTALLIGAMCIFPLVRLYQPHRESIYQLGFLVLIYAAREGDIPQKIFQFTKPTKLSFYVHPEIPLFAKILCVGIILLWFRCCWHLVNRYGRSFLEGVRKGEWLALTVLAWFCFCLSMHLQERTPWNYTYSGKVFEEVQDMLAQVMVGFALLSLVWVGMRSRESLRGAT